MTTVEITLLAIQLSSLAGILITIALLFNRKKHYEQQQKEHSAHIEKEVVNQEIKAFKQKIEELKQLVDKQQTGTAALVKDSSIAITEKPQHQEQSEQVKKTKGRKTVQVLVIDAVTEEEKVYDSIEEFATQNNLNLAACRSAKHSGHLLKKRYYIE